MLGWGQVPVIDYGGTFAAVCRSQSIRMVLAIAAAYNLECWKLDYDAAFLNANVAEDVYVKMTSEFEESDSSGLIGNEALERPLRSSPEPDQLMEHYRQKTGGSRCQKSQVGPLRLIYSEGGAIFILTLKVNGVSLLGKDLGVFERIKSKPVTRFSVADIGDV